MNEVWASVAPMPVHLSLGKLNCNAACCSNAVIQVPLSKSSERLQMQQCTARLHARPHTFTAAMLLTSAAWESDIPN